MENRSLNYINHHNSTVHRNLSLMLAVSNHSSEQEDDYDTILKFVNLYVSERIGFVLFTIGLVFNFLSFTYFQFSRSFRDTSMRHYFSVLSISDTVRLCEWLLNYLIVHEKILYLNSTVCRVFLFITIASAHVSIWLLVFLSLERYIILQFPFRGKQFYTTKNSLRMLCSVIVVLLLFDIPYLMPDFIKNYMLIQQVQLLICMHNPSYEIYRFLNNILFYSIVPFLLILLFNCLLIGILARQKKELFDMTRQDGGGVLNSKRDRQFKERTILLMVVTFFLVLTVSPRYIAQNISVSKQSMIIKV